MAYDLEDRFLPPPKYFTILDPGAYQNEDAYKIKHSKVPFSSGTARNTQSSARIWTHAIYYSDLPPKIPNCTTLKSKCPRFPYESFSKEDLEFFLCNCGIQNPCECPTEDQQNEEINCQANVRRRIFKGATPRSILSEGLSAPSKRDHGFHILSDGSTKRMKDEVTDESPPFYDTQVNESTAFYQGCKWSQWTSQRAEKLLEVRPGPGDYTFEREPTEYEICAEKFRSYRRQTSKQLRFIEMVQQRDIQEGRPGPASYSPMLPKSTSIKILGPKAERFPEKKYNKFPGPAGHWVRRDFDPLAFPEYPCHAKLPEPACFGVKALRSKPQKEEGASPASYSPNYKASQFISCSTAPFGSSVKRFKDSPIDEIVAEDESQKKVANHNKLNERCASPSWEFKSKTIRMKPLIKKLDEPSPADLSQSRNIIERSEQLQYMAPFFSSEGRFEPWYDWMPVYGKLNTPGPCYYNLDNPKCTPAVSHGPLYRSPRFASGMFQTPAPNEFKIGGGIESILATHNRRLKNNVENQNTYYWEPPAEKRKLTFEEQEALLLSKSIALLDEVDVFEDKGSESVSRKSSAKFKDKKKPKLLRSFLYSKKVSPCY